MSLGCFRLNRQMKWTAGSALALAAVIAVGLSAAPSPGGARATARPKPPGTALRANPAGPGAAAGGAVLLSGPWQRQYRFTAGETVEVSVHLERPGALPANGRVEVEWTLEKPQNPADVVDTPESGGPRAVNALEIYSKPTAGWRKVLHALDGDIYLIYRAPVTGQYRLRLAPVESEKWSGDAPRWREKGAAPEMFPLPERTPWPPKTVVPVAVSVSRIDSGAEELVQRLGAIIETEPNDTPEQAQPLTLVPNNDVRTYEITGTADDVEFFDNGKSGQSGDDWFRVELTGTEPRLVSAQIGIPGQFVAARVRCYTLQDGVSPRVPLGALLPVTEFLGKVNPKLVFYNEGKPVQVEEGRDPNERVHQQDEHHRANITRLLDPGKTYYFRVEANAPGYQLTLRVLRPAPYSDPRMAIRQGMYTHIGQVDAWLTNRPRGASVERRIRDTGNLLGTQCMSCHTQSGVWGPAVPLQNGYRLENVQNYWRLVNVMYECLRPTNVLKDAAVNTSLAPLDVGDGPAGSRAAGFNIVLAERFLAPRALHSKQQVRTANYVLQTADPGGINAAGPGSNYGQNIVWLFAGEILNTSWKKTGDPKYFRALDDKARKIAALPAKWTDDVAVRMEFFGRIFPIGDYAAQVEKAAAAERAAGQTPKGGEDAAEFIARVRAQLAEDEARLRAIQNEDGSWGFDPGSTPDGGKTWQRGPGVWDPSPTALALTGLTAVGRGAEDPSIARGVQALLKMQEPSGRWNRAAITGFISTSYALHALSRLYPARPHVPQRSEFEPQPGEPLLASVRRAQTLALSGDARFVDLMVKAARNPSALVRYWGMIGLGGTHTDAGVTVLIAALKDRAKPVRDAAIWALRQTLLDDRGWSAVLAAYERGDDYTREGVMQALGMRADAVLPQARLDWNRLTRALDRGMNDDPHPAVRAWATKAAWQWWVWNPPVRAAVNESWARMLERLETNALVEHSNRYASQALFIVNGHKSNASADHQYRELAALFELLRKRLETAEPAVKSLLARRITSVASTFFQMSGFDGGPGQLGYSTPGAGALIGQAIVVYLREVQPTGDNRAILAGLEAAANVPHGPLQEHLINYALKAPEELRKAATAAVSDPRSATFPASLELVEPLIAQVKKGAQEPSRRAALSDPVIQLFSSVMWLTPKDAEQQRLFFDQMVPRFDRYAAPEEMAAIPDPARKAEMEREMGASWYLAEQLGRVLGGNPDLHLDIVFQRYFPGEFRNPLERHFWVRSVPWLLDHNNPLPEIRPVAEVSGAAAAPSTASDDPVKARALRLYLDALRPDALPQTRAAAVSVAYDTPVRKNPEVIAALRELLKVEKDEQLKKIAATVVKQSPEIFLGELIAALKDEPKKGAGLTRDGGLDPVFAEDFVYFRDYVVPQLAGVKRSDQSSCIGCHGVRGRVPSFFLRPIEEWGYLSAPDLLWNYRELQSRVNVKDPEKSKILRKPLNIQDGTEDGHQGGRRFVPSDEGYLILKKWVENQPRVQGLASTARLFLPDGRATSELGRGIRESVGARSASGALRPG